MRYYVVGDNGQQYGPADVQTLNQWVAEGRLLPTTMLQEEAGGARFAARTLPGLQFPLSPGGTAFSQAPGGFSQPPGSFSQPPASTSQPSTVHYPRYMGGDTGNEDVKNAWICGVAGFCCCGLVAIAGIIYANNAKTKGNPGYLGPMILNGIVLGLAALVIIAQVVIMAISQH